MGKEGERWEGALREGGKIKECNDLTGGRSCLKVLCRKGNNKRLTYVNGWSRPVQTISTPKVKP